MATQTAQTRCPSCRHTPGDKNAQYCRENPLVLCCGPDEEKFMAAYKAGLSPAPTRDAYANALLSLVADSLKSHTEAAHG